MISPDQAIPDVSAPLNLNMDAGGNILPIRVPNVTGVPTGIGDTGVLAPGNSQVMPNSGAFFPAADYERAIFFTYQTLIYANGGAGFSVQADAYMQSATGHPMFNARPFFNYIPGTVSDLLQITIPGHAYCSTVHAGESPEFEIVIHNFGTVNCVGDGVHSAWWGIAVAI